MTSKPHLAVEANKKSVKYASEGNKEAWLALYAEDALVADPVIEQFWDTVIGPSNIQIRVEKRWISGDYCCCVAQVARNDLGDGKYADCDMLAVYEVNEEGLITRMQAHWDFDQLMTQIAAAAG